MIRWIMNNPIPTAIIFIGLGILVTVALLIRTVVLDSRAGFDTILDTATVTDKSYTPRQITLVPQWDPLLEQTVIRQQITPAQYHLLAVGEKDVYTINVSSRQFAQYTIGDTVYVMGRVGGNSGKVLRTWYSNTLDGKDFHDVEPRLEDTSW